MFRSPLFAWSPRLGQDQSQDPFGTPASQSSSRFGALHSNIRNMINGSSVYSQSPAPSNNNTPKVPFLGIFRRDQPSEPNLLPTSHDAPRDSHESHSPLRAQHTAGSYIRTITPPQDLQQPETIYNRHPADVPLPHQANGYADPDAQDVVNDNNERRHRRKHKRRKHRHHHQQNQWVRRRTDPRSTARGPMVFVRGTAARGKVVACTISGIFLLVVLAIYLALALTNRTLNQEVHILFILVLLTITIFFCHSLIRLCMLMLNPQSERRRAPRIPDMTGPEGFQPIVPIRVHVARDEEAAVENERALDFALDLEEKDNTPPPPPPAYGLWRSSVRVDPNLLHWQRAEPETPTLPLPQPQPQYTHRSSFATDLSYSATGAPQIPVQGPRPPSYVSEDGVTYVTEAAPRSTVRQSRSGVSDIHPAWRPGYAVSEVTVWPGRR